MDLHIQKVADRMGEKRGAGQYHNNLASILDRNLGRGSSCYAMLIGYILLDNLGDLTHY
jgi:hypothetical protein